MSPLLSDLAAVLDDDSGGASAAAGANSLDGLDDVHALGDLTEHAVLQYR
jgi:hypothetical protein